MARRAEGWKLVLRGRVYRVRFTYSKRRYEVTTGESDARKAAIVAGQVYADVVSGRLTVTRDGRLTHPSTPLDEMCVDWLTAIQPEIGRKTGATYGVYMKHWCLFFESIGRVTTGNAANYTRSRLLSVTRATVAKEVSALRQFLAWAFEQELIGIMPEIRLPPKKALGKRHAQGRRAPTHLSTEQCEAVLAALPERGRARGGVELVIRDYFTFCYETGLRPEGTVDLLEERDFTPLGLHIRPELDKNRWERTVPLSARAAAILGRLITGAPGQRFFGDRDRRDAWRKAAVAALGEAGKAVNPYDLKHARVTSWFSAGKDPMGVRFLTGTKEAIDKYALPSRLAADRVMWGGSGNTDVGDSAKDENRTRTGVTPLEPEARRDDENIGYSARNAVSATGDSALTSSKEPLSGAPPQFTPAAFRALSSAWFRSVAQDGKSASRQLPEVGR